MKPNACTRYVDVYRHGRRIYVGLVDEATQEQITNGEHAGHAPLLHWGNGWGFIYLHQIPARDGWTIVVREDQTTVPATDRGYRHFTNGPLRD